MDMTLFGFIEDHATAEPLKLLIRFHHGLGDTVQLGVVLKHLRRYRPNWTVDVWCGRGKETALAGLCRRVYHDRQTDQVDFQAYDRIVEPGFFESRDRLAGVPATKAVDTLRNVFGIDYDASLGRYEIRYSAHDGIVTYCKAMNYFKSIGAVQLTGPYNVVVFHASGNTSQSLKNLCEWQLELLCEQVLAAGRIPVILDWDHRSQLPDQKRTFCLSVARPGDMDLWGGFGSGDAATIAALIQLSEAFVGVDSGPGKIASATDTPSLICWIGHHPMNFHDPAPNTTHLVPHDHWKMEPLSDRVREDPDGPCGYPELAAYFAENYKYQTYQNGQHGLLWEAQRWLAEVLQCPIPSRKIAYVMPGGIGDSAWAMHKIRAVNRKANPCRDCQDGWQLTDRMNGPEVETTREICGTCHGIGAGPIDIIVSGDPSKEVDQRAVPFLNRFKFVNSVRVLDIPHLLDPQRPNDPQGRYRYQPDGLRGGHYFLMPNHALERGQTLAEWLPDVPVDWEVMDEFELPSTETNLSHGDFVVFYLGPKSGNTEEGHNRGPIWRPRDWMRLGRLFNEWDVQVYVIGAGYDRSYWEEYVKPLVEANGQDWNDCYLGKMPIESTFQFLQHARCLISYQSGLGIVHHYLGGKVCMWWRPDGDSIHPGRMVSFDQKMADSWCNQKLRENYIPLIYGEQTADQVFEMIRARGWV
jgi:ADP-heptose:LPS heptosyltransferase